MTSGLSSIGHTHAAALKVFVAQGVDVVVLEVGVGGRLDATNIIPAPVVCGITSLGMDHMEILGDTLPVSAKCMRTSPHLCSCWHVEPCHH